MDALSQSDEATLRELEESLWRSESRFDRTHMERVLAEDFFEYGRSGRIYTREDTLAVPPEPILVKLPFEGWTARLLDGETAQVTYISEVQYDELLRANRSSVWSRTSGGWKLRFHQGTPAR